ncbi:MAG: hypothetical protein A2Y93_06970 [Chloroflexi bacterium RBG_13_68_17]|nr:MAG: hypothetical protein A2Y93_06970 [Chloroflexi bacterium RBG_13_68_17]
MLDVLAWSQAVLRTTPARWAALTEALPAELLRRPPAEAEWSALACLEHLVEAEREVFPVRVTCFLEGRDFAAFNPDAENARPGASPDPVKLAQEFARLRTMSFRVLAPVEEADLTRTARHPELGSVTLGELIHEWAGHDLMHTVQAERALMQPFIEGCGPWLPYFADHVAARARADR